MSRAEWTRNNPGATPNSYERCRELIRIWRDDFALFEIEEKVGGRWVLHEIWMQ